MSFFFIQSYKRSEISLCGTQSPQHRRILTKSFSSKLQEQEVDLGRIYTSRLKERISTAFPDLTAVAQGRDVVLVLKEDLGDMIKLAKTKDSEAYHLAKAAKIVRDMLQAAAVPASLKILIDKILKDATINEEQLLTLPTKFLTRHPLPFHNYSCSTTSHLFVTRHGREKVFSSHLCNLKNPQD